MLQSFSADPHYYIAPIVDKQTLGLLFDNIINDDQCIVVLRHLQYYSQCIKYGQKKFQHCPSRIYSILVILHFEKRLDPGVVNREMTQQQQSDTENYWQNELRSLGIELKRKNKLNDKEELQALADSIKQAYYQDYKTVYSEEDDGKVKASDFGHII